MASLNSPTYYNNSPRASPRLSPKASPKSMKKKRIILDHINQVTDPDKVPDLIYSDNRKVDYMELKQSYLLPDSMPMSINELKLITSEIKSDIDLSSIKIGKLIIDDMYCNLTKSKKVRKNKKIKNIIIKNVNALTLLSEIRYDELTSIELHKLVIDYQSISDIDLSLFNADVLVLKRPNNISKLPMRCNEIIYDYDISDESFMKNKIKLNTTINNLIEYKGSAILDLLNADFENIKVFYDDKLTNVSIEDILKFKNLNSKYIKEKNFDKLNNKLIKYLYNK